MSATRTVGQLLAETLGRLRVEQRHSARGLAALAEEERVPGLDRQRIANLETGRGRPMSVQEWLDLSYLLGPPGPGELLGPHDFLVAGPLYNDIPASEERLWAWSNGEVELHPGRVTSLGWLSDWISGLAPRPGYQLPDGKPVVWEAKKPTAEEAMAAIVKLAQVHGLTVTFAPATKGRK